MRVGEILATLRSWGLEASLWREIGLVWPDMMVISRWLWLDCEGALESEQSQILLRVLFLAYFTLEDFRWPVSSLSACWKREKPGLLIGR